MHCPICRDTRLAEIDYHANGLAHTKECHTCGAAWSRTDQELSMISVPRRSYVSRSASTSS